MDNIINYMRTEAPLLAPIFRSDGQARLLAELFLGDPASSLTELSERTNLAYGTVHREVGRLLDAGILTEQHVGRTRLVSPNRDGPLYEPLLQILLVSTGPVPLLTQELADIPGVEAAFLFGSFAARTLGAEGAPPGDIDVMVVGTPNAELVYDACDHVAEKVHRPVNPTILTEQEIQQETGFHQQIRASPIISIVGESPWG